MSAFSASLLFGLIAGTCDAATYLSLHRIFASHITGNLLLLGADWAVGREGEMLGRLIAIPVFMVWAWLMRVLAGWLRRRGHPALRRLLVIMTALLLVFALLGLTVGPFASQDSANTLLVAMIGVAAMGTLNIVARLWPSLAAGSTAMTGNAVRMLIDLAELALGERHEEPSLLFDSSRLGLSLLAFTGGCALAALVYVAAGTWCLVLPLLFAVCMLILAPEESGQDG